MDSFRLYARREARNLYHSDSPHSRILEKITGKGYEEGCRHAGWSFMSASCSEKETQNRERTCMISPCSSVYVLGGHDDGTPFMFPALLCRLGRKYSKKTESYFDCHLNYGSRVRAIL
jgi:hypothetical protein